MIAMFKSVEPLDSSRHREVMYRGVPDYGFARKVISAPLAASEVVKAAREFPIVFTGRGKLLPVALFSVSGGGNAFVSEDGRWEADYVPAHIRRYPFVLGETGQEDRFVVMIDRDAPQFDVADGQGEALFAKDGAAPENGIVARARTFLSQFQGELTRTRALLQPLEDAGVLVERCYEINHEGRRETGVSGFRLVDTEKLLGLDDATLAGWVRSGLMALVQSHINSLDNGQRLQRHQRAATSSKDAERVTG